MSNIEAVREYRRAVDAAEGARLALGLREVIDSAVAEHEISLECATQGHALLDQVHDAVGGVDVATLERKVKRLRDAIVRANMDLVWHVARRTMGKRRSNQANLE